MVNRVVMIYPENCEVRNPGSISPVFLSARDGAEAERMAIRLPPSEFKRFRLGGSPNSVRHRLW